MPLHPTVLWAQRADLIYLTVEVADIKEHKVNVTDNKFTFTGVGEKEKNEYQAEIEFLEEVDPDKSKQHLTARHLTVVVYKKKEGYWPKLQKGGKPHFLKVDFQKWKDEDDDEDSNAPNDPMGGMDFASLMQQAGGAGGFPGMGSMGGMGGMDALNAMNAMGAMGAMGNNDGQEEQEGEEEEAEKK